MKDLTIAYDLQTSAFVSAQHPSVVRGAPAADQLLSALQAMTLSCSTIISFVSPDRELGLRLLPVARRIFSEAFAHLYDERAFETFCDRTYAPDGPMARDLADPGISWRVAIFHGEPIGYAKLTPLRAPVPDARQNALELQQIYVLSRWHGQGVAG